MQSTNLVNNLLTIQTQGNSLEVKEPLLLPGQRRTKKKNLGNDDVRDCIHILKKGRRKACCTVWTMRLAIVTTAVTGFYLSLKKYFQTETDFAADASADEISQRSAKDAFAKQFVQLSHCRYEFPNALSMMWSRSRDDCCLNQLFYRETHLFYAPCFERVILDPLLLPCYKIINQYCLIRPTVFRPLGDLIGLGTSCAVTGLLILLVVINTFLESLGKDSKFFFNPMSRLEKFFISPKDMEKIRIVATRYGIDIDDKNVRKILSEFELYYERFKRKIAFIQGAHDRLGQNSSLHDHFFKSALFESHTVRQIFEFSGDSSLELKETPEISLAVPSSPS